MNKEVHVVIWAATWDFQQCGMCDQQRLRPACAYAQSDQSLCKSLEYSMSVTLLTEHHLEFLCLKGGYKSPCQNATLLEITCHNSILYGLYWKVYYSKSSARKDWLQNNIDTRAVAWDFQQCGFWHMQIQTSLCSLLLILETPSGVQSVAWQS